MKKQRIIEEVSKETSTTDKGKKFFDLYVNEYFHPSDDNKFTYLDGSGDGKIDGYRICLIPDGPLRWDIVQTKFGTSFSGVDTVISETKGFLANVKNPNFKGKDDTFDGFRQFLKTTREGNLPNYVKYYFITSDPIDDGSSKVVKELEISFFNSTGVRLYAECLSLDNLEDETRKGTIITLKSNFLYQHPENKDFFKGTITFDDLYKVIKESESQGNKDSILNGNVRGYQGSNKVNQGILDTAQNSPEKFILRNLGITMLSDGIDQIKNGIFILRNPQIINGGQSTTGLMKAMNFIGGKKGNPGALVNIDIIDTTNLPEEEINRIKLCRNTSIPVSHGDKKSLEDKNVKKLAKKIKSLGYKNVEYRTSEKTKGRNKLNNIYVFDVIKIAFSTIRENLLLTTLSLDANKGWPHYVNMINELLEDCNTPILKAMVELTQLKGNKICKPYQQFVFAFILYRCMKAVIFERPIGIENLDPGKINVYISKIINNWDDRTKEFLLNGVVRVYKDYVEGPKIVADLGATYSSTDLPKHLKSENALRLEISISMIFLPRVSSNDPEYQEFLNKVGKILSN
jgi:hypothetical protein